MIHTASSVFSPKLGKAKNIIITKSVPGSKNAADGLFGKSPVCGVFRPLGRPKFYNSDKLVLCQRVHSSWARLAAVLTSAVLTKPY